MKKIWILSLSFCILVSAHAYASGLHRYYDKRFDAWGYKNDAGKVVIEAEYAMAGEFSEGLAAVGIFSKYEDTPHLFGFIDETGKMKINLSDSLWTDSSTDGAFHEGRARVLCIAGGEFGYIDSSGTLRIKGEFNRAGPFSEGLAFAAILHQGRKPNQEEDYNYNIGYIDTAGKWVFQLPADITVQYGGCYYHGEPFKNGKAKMVLRENYSDCNTTDSFVIDNKGIILYHIPHE